MARKPPHDERKLILAADQRRKYGVRLIFEVLRPQHIDRIEGMSLLLEDGTIAEISATSIRSTESGKRYEIATVGFPKASEAEEAGNRIAQALLLTSISLNFGLRLRYDSYEPSSVYDRTVSAGITTSGEAFSYYPAEVFLEEFSAAHRLPPVDRRLLLSMELYSASALESNDRAQFVMAVSALEPLAAQTELGEDAVKSIEKLAEVLDAETHLSVDLRASLRQRLLHLKRESIRQALRRVCDQFLPGENGAWKRLDAAYALRSELLHEGRPNDLDILLSQETAVVSNLLRRIYAEAMGIRLKASAVV